MLVCGDVTAVLRAVVAIWQAAKSKPIREEKAERLEQIRRDRQETWARMPGRSLVPPSHLANRCILRSIKERECDPAVGLLCAAPLSQRGAVVIPSERDLGHRFGGLFLSVAMCYPKVSSARLLLTSLHCRSIAVPSTLPTSWSDFFTVPSVTALFDSNRYSGCGANAWNRSQALHRLWISDLCCGAYRRIHG
jgi:hypothetical protein